MDLDAVSLWGGEWADKKHGAGFLETVYVVKKMSPPTMPRYRAQFINQHSGRKKTKLMLENFRRFECLYNSHKNFFFTEYDRSSENDRPKTTCFRKS